MRTPGNPSFVLIPKKGETWETWAQRFVTSLGRWLADLANPVNGNLSFWDGTDYDNLKGKWLTFTSSETPGAELTLTHNLGTVPTGFLVIVPPASGTVNTGTTPWTTSAMYVSTSAGTQTVTIFALLA